MPTVLRLWGARFYFFSGDRDEPPHVHVEQGEKTAKFWVDPVSLAYSHGFAPHELTRVERLVRANQNRLLEAWCDYFGA